MENTPLFLPSLYHLPLIFEGETLYSWCCRYHLISGNWNPKTTSRILFGSCVAGFRTDFPTHFNMFHSRTNGVLGDCENVILCRTQFSFYVPFINEQVAIHIWHHILTGTGTSARVSLGLARSGVDVITPLKACKECMRIDRLKNRLSWWHVEHQWPTVAICLIHNIPLSILDCSKINMDNNWVLPPDPDSKLWKSQDNFTEKQIYILIKIAKITKDIVTKSDLKIQEKLLRQVYLVQAEKFGWVSMQGLLRLKSLTEAFESEFDVIKSVSGFRVIQNMSGAQGGFIGHLTRYKDGQRHPLKHILMIALLFSDYIEFKAVYESVKQSIKGNEDRVDQIKEKLKINLLKIITKDGQSVIAAAESLSLESAQLLRHVRKVGIPYKRNILKNNSS